MRCSVSPRNLTLWFPAGEDKVGTTRPSQLLPVGEWLGNRTKKWGQVNWLRWGKLSCKLISPQVFLTPNLVQMGVIHKFLPDLGAEHLLWPLWGWSKGCHILRSGSKGPAGGCGLTSDWELWTTSSKAPRNKQPFITCFPGFDTAPAVAARTLSWSYCTRTIFKHTKGSLCTWQSYSTNCVKREKGGKVDTLCLKPVTEQEPRLGEEHTWPIAHQISSLRPHTPPDLYHAANLELPSVSWVYA